MSRRVSRHQQRQEFSVAVQVEQVILSAATTPGSRMSVYAFDQLLLSATGKPALTSANKRRSFLLDARVASSSTTAAPQPWTLQHEQVLSFNQRFPFQGKLRKKAHGFKPQVLSLRLYGLKKTGWPRTLLAAFSVDMMDHLEDLKALHRSTTTLHSRHAVELTAANGICSDSKVKLFFDSLLLHPTNPCSASATTLLPTRASEPIVGAGDDVRNSNGATSAWRSMLAAPLQLLSPISVDGASGARTGGVFFHRALPPPPLERQIELVDWSPRPVAPTRPRRRSSYEPREFGWGDYDVDDEDEEDEDEDEEEGEGEDGDRRRMTRQRRRRASLANAEVSQQLMERKLSVLELPPSQYVELQAHHSDDTLSESSRTFLVAPMATTKTTKVTTATTTSLTMDRREQEREMNALRAENEEQRELLRRLLAENRRLSHALKRCQCSDAAAAASASASVEPAKKTAAVRPERSDCGVHETMSASPTLKPRAAAMRPRRRSSLTLAVVDGEETLVDPKFDHLVHEIESVFASLLGNDEQEQQQQQQQYSEHEQQDTGDELLLLLPQARCQ